MKSKFSPRWVYGIGLALVAIGLVMPMVDIFFGTINGFDILEVLNFAKSGIKVAGYILFICACVGAICAFLKDLKIVDTISFVGIIGSILYVLVRLGIKSSGSAKAVSFFKDIALNMLEIGVYVFVLGLIVAIIGFVLSLGKKR